MHFSDSPRLTQPEPQRERTYGYDQETAERVVSYVAETNLSLREICANHKDVPSVRTVQRWRREHPEFDTEIRLAQAGRIEDLEIECIGIADEAAAGAKVAITRDGKETEVSITTPIDYLDRQLKTRLMLIAKRTAGMASAAAAREGPKRAIAPPPEDDPLKRAMDGWKARGLIEAK